MAEEDNKSEQEQEQVQEEEPVQEPAEMPQDQPDEKKSDKDGLLMPILYALLAAVGAFTLVLIIGITMTFVTQPAEPSAEPSSRVTFSPSPTQTQAPQETDSEGSNADDIS